MTNTTIERALFALAVVAVCFIGYALCETMLTAGRIDYCYVDNIQGNTGGYEVIGHRPWSRNAHLGVSGSPQGANEIALNSASCPK